ncbi:MAG: transcriptional regulator [Eubacteriales bacterium]|nr:transcriptional regulator [Eubacteriales bacterium]
MDNLTNMVRAEIARQYKSVRQFAFDVGIPLSTINSAIHNGIGGSSYDTVLQICHKLGIKAGCEEGSAYLTDDTERLVMQYEKLDNYGRHTIASVMQVEYDRCTNESATKKSRRSKIEE